jgi:hypothetical protein
MLDPLPPIRIPSPLLPLLRAVTIVLGALMHLSKHYCRGSDRLRRCEKKRLGQSSLDIRMTCRSVPRPMRRHSPVERGCHDDRTKPFDNLPNDRRRHVPRPRSPHHPDARLVTGSRHVATRTPPRSRTAGSRSRRIDAHALLLVSFRRSVSHDRPSDLSATTSTLVLVEDEPALISIKAQNPN